MGNDLPGLARSERVRLDDRECNVASHRLIQ
jgi:hypothetical protein